MGGGVIGLDAPAVEQELGVEAQGGGTAGVGRLLEQGERSGEVGGIAGAVEKHLHEVAGCVVDAALGGLGIEALGFLDVLVPAQPLGIARGKAVLGLGIAEVGAFGIELQREIVLLGEF